MANIIKIGTKFNKLTFVGYSEKRSRDGHMIGVFCCDCGKTKSIIITRVKFGHTKTCGCLVSETARKKAFKHGKRSHFLYSVYRGMMNRCYMKHGKDYDSYGGRGIIVCDRWHDIKNFIEDMEDSYKKGLTLDRIDNNGSYSKENCKWSNCTEQARNKRTNIIHNGEYATDASKRLGGSLSLISMRLSRGWSKDRAFNTSLKKHD